MEPVTSADLRHFLDTNVNLKRDRTQAYREQVRHLRERLTQYVGEHPDFALQKMLHFGSLAKGTAISTFHEMDVAVYLRPEGVPDRALPKVLQQVRELLLQVYPQMAPSQIVINPPAVTVSFECSGLLVDVVPVLPNGKPDDRGLLVLREGGDWVETSIPLHLEFIRCRAERHPNFRPLVRLVKWWAQHRDLPLASFVLELIWAEIYGQAAVPDDLQEALLAFFGYIARTQLLERVVFADNYPKSSADVFTDPIQIVDPVNPGNNVCDGVGDGDRQRTVLLAREALDAVAAGSTAPGRGNGIEEYAKVFGTGFGQ